MTSLNNAVARTRVIHYIHRVLRETGPYYAHL
jgi:hypothetical protein